MRARDTLLTPKTPGFVVATGQVFKPVAVVDRLGKCAPWYLGRSGGSVQMAQEKAIVVIRADGSVIGAKENFWSGSSFGQALESGDAVVVAEKAIIDGVPCRPSIWRRRWFPRLLAECSPPCATNRT